jgi:hypothetical protein
VTDQTNLNVRQPLIAVFLFGAIGVGFELILLGHTEETWQWVPIVLLGTSIPLATALAFKPTRGVIRLFTFIMVVFIGAGGIGLIQHFRGNLEFELEMYPSMGGWELLWEALKGATPTLAPGTMTLLGLIGIIYTFRHPLAGADQ